MTAKQAGEYVARNIFLLQRDISIELLTQAWNVVVAANDILRTRIVDLPEQGLVQVVINAASPCIIQQGLEDYVKADKVQEIGLGKPLTRAAIITDCEGGACYFVWTIHHALYDGWSMPLLLRQLETAYRSGSIGTPPTPFQGFIGYIATANQQSTRHYWQGQLADCEAAPFPALPAASYQPMASQLLEHTITGFHWPKGDTTLSTILRAAWAIVIGRHTASDDVAFGAVSNGRQAPVPGIERMTGPTIATVPVRIKLRKSSVRELLSKMQSQAVEMVPHEQFGLFNIQKLGPGAKQACQFQSVVVVQPKAEAAVDSHKFALLSREEQNKAAGLGNSVGQFVTYALMLTCRLDDRGKIDVEMQFDATVVAPALANLLANQFDQVFCQLCQPGMSHIPVNDIETTSQRDLQQIWTWNAAVPTTVEACVHDLFAERVCQQPNAPAVCAWDGELTYSELDALSTRLAYHLAGLG
ncbi:condensation-domain-containing protein, partial [Colletotrichum somersetense]